MNNTNSLYCFSLAALMMPMFASSAPGELATQPLTFVISPQPNIMLLLDDSGSMYNTNVITNSGQTLRSTSVDGVGTTVASRRRDSQIENEDHLYELCVGYNALAYNPAVQYVPWESISDTSDNGSNSLYQFDDKTRTTALSTTLQYNRFTDTLSKGFTNNLSNYIYFRWDDADGDGILDANECGPSFSTYDNAVVRPMNNDPELIDLDTSPINVLADSGGTSANYSVNEDLTFTIDVPVTGDPGTLTLSITTFNLDNKSSTLKDGSTTSFTDGTRDNSDRLLVYTGEVTSTAEFNSITTVTNQSVADVTSFEADDRSLKSPYVLYHKVANNSVSQRVKKLVINGSKATFRFISNSNGFQRSGFAIAWQHSSDTGSLKDAVITADDCENPVDLVNPESSEHHCVVIDNLPATAADVPENAKYPHNTQQNYANWYTYYRTRDYAAKQALGKIITNSDHRMGLATINDRGNGGVIAKDMSTSSASYNESTFVHGDKDTLLKRLYESNTNGSKFSGNDGTALRKFLANAGRYFQESTEPEKATSIGQSNFLGTNFEYDTIISASHATESGDVLDSTTPMFNIGNGGQCQQNFALLVTDGAWNGSFSSGTVDNADADSGSDPDESLYAGGNYADTYSDTLADVAMKYFEEDLSGTLEDELSLNLNGQSVSHQHMVTFAIGFGVDGTIPSAPGTWTNPTTTDAHKIDDILHATYNGRGGYFSASDSEALQNSLDTIIQEINVRTNNTATGVALSSYQLNDGAVRYDVSYRPEGWWGDMQAYEFVNDGFSDTAVWSANDVMTAQSNRATERQIITFNGTQGIPFLAPADYRNLSDTTAAISSIQLNDLMSEAPYSISATDATQVTQNQTYLNSMVSYLRGSPSLDGGELSLVNTANEAQPIRKEFRDRGSHYIGALIHSQPRYVGRPNQGYPDDIETTPYSDFVTARKYRRPIVYVGGNDGMLHAFYASSSYVSGVDNNGEDVVTVDTDNVGGKELFAYVPQIVSNESVGGKKLSTFVQPVYESTPYVDGDFVIADVFVDKANDNTKRWRSYLVGGFRSGGKGIYVLDVTNPDVDTDTNNPYLVEAQTNASDIIVKEFTHDDLNFVYGRPVIAKMANGRWAAIVPSGYASTEASAVNNGDGTAKLFVIYLDALGGSTIIEASSNIWPATQSCSGGTTDCSLSELRSVRALYRHNTDQDENPDQYTVKAFAQNYDCTEAVFGAAASGYSLPGCEVSEIDFNGLSAPSVVDTNADSIADRAYAGDLHGALWAFDLSSSNESEWGVDDGSSSPSLANEPLFISCRVDLVNGVCPEGGRQPVTSKPLVVSHPNERSFDTLPNAIVLFGTGQYVVEGDKETTDQQAFYGVWDAGSLYRANERDDLTAQSFTNDTDLNGNVVGRTGSDESVSYALTGQDANFGWNIDFPETPNPDAVEGSPAEYRERTIISAVVLDNVLVFASFIPNEGTCNASSGTSFINAVELINGSALSNDFFGAETVVDGKYYSGVAYKGAIVGLDVIRKPDGKDALQINRDDGSVSILDVTSSSGTVSAGRKSWSILR